MVKILRYASGLLFVLLLLCADALIGREMFSRWFYIFAASLGFILLRLMVGPTNPDRALAFKAASVTVVGLCLALSVAVNNDIYADIAIAWALQSYLATLFLGKYFEGGRLYD